MRKAEVEAVLLVDAWPMNNASQCDLVCFLQKQNSEIESEYKYECDKFSSFATDLLSYWTTVWMSWTRVNTYPMNPQPLFWNRKAMRPQYYLVAYWKYV